MNIHKFLQTSINNQLEENGKDLVAPILKSCQNV